MATQSFQELDSMNLSIFCQKFHLLAKIISPNTWPTPNHLPVPKCVLVSKFLGPCLWFFWLSFSLLSNQLSQIHTEWHLIINLGWVFFLVSRWFQCTPKCGASIHHYFCVCLPSTSVHPPQQTPSVNSRDLSTYSLIPPMGIHCVPFMCQASFICIPDHFPLLLSPHEAPSIKPGSKLELNKSMFYFTEIIPRVFWF